MKRTLAVQTLITCVCAHGLWMEMMLNDLLKEPTEAASAP